MMFQKRKTIEMDDSDRRNTKNNNYRKFQHHWLIYLNKILLSSCKYYLKKMELIFYHIGVLQKNISKLIHDTLRYF